MSSNRMLYLTRQDVAAAGVTMAEIIDLLVIAFNEKGKARTDMPP